MNIFRNPLYKKFNINYKNINNIYKYQLETSQNNYEISIPFDDFLISSILDTLLYYNSINKLNTSFDCIKIINNKDFTEWIERNDIKSYEDVIKKLSKYEFILNNIIVRN